jgi:hypothetical protein
MKTRIEFLFAHWAVPMLKELRGARWRDLMVRVSRLESTHPDSLAFALTMVRINGCVSCDAKRYRERGGCANCSRFVLTTLNKETESELIMRFNVAQKEIARNLKMRQTERAAA